MRVLQVIRDMHPREGGPPRVLSGASVGLSRAGLKVTAASGVVMNDQDAVRRSCRDMVAEGVDVRLFPRSAPLKFGGSRAFSRWVAENARHYDVVHLHGVWDACLTAAGRAARSSDVPVLISPHGMLDRWSMARSRAKKVLALRLAGTGTLLDSADGLIFGTREEEAEAAAVTAVAGRSFIIPNGVDGSVLGARDKRARDRLCTAIPSCAGWSRIVLFYSRFHPKKGIDLLVEAFARVLRDFPDAGLLAAGIAEDRDYEARVVSRVRELGLESRIVLTTDLAGPESRYVYDAADLFALPSHQEGFSMAIIEAMARELPVLITDRCHLDLVSDLGAGVVVPATVDGLETGLRQLLRLSDEDRAVAGAAGRMFVESRCTWPKVVEQLVAAYGQCRNRRAQKRVSG
jgi:glycosyltransferase involved in cell wall biosynthesis